MSGSVGATFTMSTAQFRALTATSKPDPKHPLTTFLKQTELPALTLNPQANKPNPTRKEYIWVSREWQKIKRLKALRQICGLNKTYRSAVYEITSGSIEKSTPAATEAGAGASDSSTQSAQVTVTAYQPTLWQYAILSQHPQATEMLDALLPFERDEHLDQAAPMFAVTMANGQNDLFLKLLGKISNRAKRLAIIQESYKANYSRTPDLRYAPIPEYPYRAAVQHGNAEGLALYRQILMRQGYMPGEPMPAGVAIETSLPLDHHCDWHRTIGLTLPLNDGQIKSFDSLLIHLAISTDNLPAILELRRYEDTQLEYDTREEGRFPTALGFAAVLGKTAAIHFLLKLDDPANPGTKFPAQVTAKSYTTPIPHSLCIDGHHENETLASSALTAALTYEHFDTAATLVETVKQLPEQQDQADVHRFHREETERLIHTLRGESAAAAGSGASSPEEAHRERILAHCYKLVADTSLALTELSEARVFPTPTSDQAELHQLRDDLQDANSEIELRERQITNQTQLIIELENTLSQTQKTVATLKAQYAETSVLLSETLTSYRTTAQKLVKLQEVQETALDVHLAPLKQALAASEGTVQSLETRCAETEKSLQKQTQTLTGKERVLADLKSKLIAAHKTRIALENVYAQEATALKTKLARAETNLRHKGEELATLTRIKQHEVEAMQAQIDSLKIELADSNATQETLKELTSNGDKQILDLQAKVAQTAHDLKVARSEAKDWRLEAEKEATMRAQPDQRLTELATENQSLKISVTSLGAQIKMLQAELALLRDAKGEVETARISEQLANRKIEELTKTLGSRTQQFTDASLALGESDAGRRKAESKLAELTSENARLRQLLATKTPPSSTFTASWGASPRQMLAPSLPGFQALRADAPPFAHPSPTNTYSTTPRTMSDSSEEGFAPPFTTAAWSPPLPPSPPSPALNSTLFFARPSAAETPTDGSAPPPVNEEDDFGPATAGLAQLLG